MEKEEIKKHLEKFMKYYENGGGQLYACDEHNITDYLSSISTPSPDLLEKAKREAEEVDVWKLRTESEALEASSFTLDDWEEIEGFAIEVYKKAYIKGRLKTN